MNLTDYFGTISGLCNAMLLHKDPKSEAVDEVKFSSEIDMLNKLTKLVSFSPAYNRMHENMMARLKNRLESDRDFQFRASQWKSMSPDQRLSLMETLARHQAIIQEKIYSIPVHSTPYDWLDEDEKLLGKTKTKIFDINHQNDKTFLNRYMLENCSLAEAMHIATHEQTHIFHIWMCRAFLNNMIKKDHALYKDYNLITHAKCNRGYIPSSINTPYWLQFDEIDAEKAGLFFKEYGKRIQTKTLPRQSPNMLAWAAGIALTTAAIGLITQSRKPAPIYPY